jgi:hypothetical protein
MIMKRRSIRRIVIRACIFLLLGAVVNIAVAWGIAARTPLYESVTSYDRRIWPPLKWPDYLEKLGWPEPYETLARGGHGGAPGSMGATIVQTLGGENSPGSAHVALRVGQFGLPWRTLQWEHHGVLAPARASEIADAAAAAAGWRIGFDVSNKFGTSIKGEVRRLPLTPLWPGFTINTLFYAAILWLLFAAPFALRRMRRIKRGLCPVCAYPVGASPVCTECGKPVRPRKAKNVEPAPS